MIKTNWEGQKVEKIEIAFSELHCVSKIISAGYKISSLTKHRSELHFFSFAYKSLLRTKKSESLPKSWEIINEKEWPAV
jgi:hypothetical protein